MQDDVIKQPLLVEVAIEAASRAEHEKLMTALAKLTADDHSFIVSFDPESGQTVLKGPSESHLKGKIELLDRVYGIAVTVGAWRVVFLERPTTRAEVTYTHKKIYGPKGDFAAVKLGVGPIDPGKGFHFESKVDEDVLPREYLPGVEKGLKDVLACGVVAGFPVIDVGVELIDARYHDVDSSVLAFEIATRAAFREALKMAKPVLLEPIMKVEVVTPTAFAESIADDLRLRRGQVRFRDAGDDTAAIDAIAPLMTMLGYANSLGLVSDGRATCVMRFDHYAPMPSPESDPPFRPAIGMRA
ncbi:translation elongation factor EF-G [Bradyrhizobium sp. USDA 377]